MDGRQKKAVAEVGKTYFKDFYIKQTQSICICNRMGPRAIKD